MGRCKNSWCKKTSVHQVALAVLATILYISHNGTQVAAEAQGLGKHVAGIGIVGIAYVKRVARQALLHIEHSDTRRISSLH